MYSNKALLIILRYFTRLLKSHKSIHDVLQQLGRRRRYNRDREEGLADQSPWFRELASALDAMRNIDPNDHYSDWRTESSDDDDYPIRTQAQEALVLVSHDFTMALCLVPTRVLYRCI